MKVWIVQGEHFNTPGCVVRVFGTRSGADTEAASLVNVILADKGMDEDATRDNWESRLEDVDSWAEGDCDVWVMESEITDLPQSASRTQLGDVLADVNACASDAPAALERGNGAEVRTNLSCLLDMAREMLTKGRDMAQADRCLLALAALLNWGRDHTSPRDPNSPHDLLVEAHAALVETGAQLLPDGSIGWRDAP